MQYVSSFFQTTYQSAPASTLNTFARECHASNHVYLWHVSGRIQAKKCSSKSSQKCAFNTSIHYSANYGQTTRTHSIRRNYSREIFSELMNICSVNSVNNEDIFLLQAVHPDINWHFTSTQSNFIRYQFVVSLSWSLFAYCRMRGTIQKVLSKSEKSVITRQINDIHLPSSTNTSLNVRPLL